MGGGDFVVVVVLLFLSVYQCTFSLITIKPGPHSGTSGKTNAVTAFLELAKALGNRPLFQNIIFNNYNYYNNGN